MSSPSEPPATQSDLLDRVLRALSHPVRRKVLSSLARRRGSAKTISAELGVPLTNVSYHLATVLAEQCGVVEPVQDIQRRGATEHIYTIKTGAFNGVVPWTDLPEPFWNVLRRYPLEEFLAASAEAVRSSSLDTGREPILEWTPNEFDDHGWLEMEAAVEDFREALRTAEANSRRRGRRRSKSGEQIGAVVGVALLQPAANGPLPPLSSA